jgi:hypothetical protein
LPGVTYNRICYNKRYNILAGKTIFNIGGTVTNHIILWKRTNFGVNIKWEPIQKIDVGGKMKEISWGMCDNELTIQKESGFTTVTEQVLYCAAYGTELLISQTGTKSLSIQNYRKDTYEYQYNQKIKSLQLNQQTMAIWNGLQLDTYKFGIQ